jgi:hypothetical protein
MRRRSWQSACNPHAAKYAWKASECWRQRPSPSVSIATQPQAMAPHLEVVGPCCCQIALNTPRVNSEVTIKMPRDTGMHLLRGCTAVAGQWWAACSPSGCLSTLLALYCVKHCPGACVVSVATGALEVHRPPQRCCCGVNCTCYLHSHSPWCCVLC